MVNEIETFSFNNRVYSFLNFPKFEPPYMLFDVIKKETKKVTSKDSYSKFNDTKVCILCFSTTSRTSR